ncbi:MAG: energy transducer TonB [Prevotella sp.]|nr:energy transducer TonB [Prevotella sp.]MBO4658638.1 energy transducer TonB [Prevotella sp.]
MKRGKKICKTLKEVRMQVAKANDIAYAPTECHHEGDCAGTCPKCEAEVRYIEQQLQLRRQLGKAVAVMGVSMGLAALTSCESQLADLDAVRDATTAVSQPVGSKVPNWMGDVVEHQPSFPGGMQALLKFLSENITYPLQEESVTGRVVVRFVVETDGSITEPQVVRSLHPQLDAEALRVISLMPKWEPAMQGDMKVRCVYNIPIKFEVEQSAKDTISQ